MNEITGAMLKQLRKKNEMSLSEVEHKAQIISSSYLSQLENDKVSNPSYKIIMKLLDLYNVKVNIDLKSKL